MALVNHSFLVLLFLCICCNIIKAQDLGFNQFHSNTMYLNPAIIATEDRLRIGLNYRNQWPFVAGVFNSYSLGISSTLPSIGKYIFGGGGILVSKYEEGEGQLTTNRVKGIFSLATGSQNFAAALGLSCSYNNVSINWDELVFSDQLDPINGVIRETTAPYPHYPIKHFANIDVGIVFIYLGNNANEKFSSIESRIGFVANHVRQNHNISITGLETLNPIRYTLHGSMSIPINSKSKNIINPHFKIDWQNKSRSFNYGFYALISENLILGTQYQNRNIYPIDVINTNSYVFLTGFKGPINNPNKKDQGEYQLLLSIDVNGGGLGPQSSNAYEISLVYKFKNAINGKRNLDDKAKKKYKTNDQKCPSESETRRKKIHGSFLRPDDRPKKLL